MDTKRIIRRLASLEYAAGLIIQEATKLKQELSGVVSDSSTRKGLSESHIKKVIGNRERTRLKQ